MRLQGTIKRGGDFQSPDYFLTNSGVKELNFSDAASYRDGVKALEFYISSHNTEFGILFMQTCGGDEDPVFENEEELITDMILTADTKRWWESS